LLGENALGFNSDVSDEARRNIRTIGDRVGEVGSRDSGKPRAGPRNSVPKEEHSAESAFQSGLEKRHVVHVLSRAFSARTLLVLVPRASPQAFLSHGFAAVIAEPSTKTDKPHRDERNVRMFSPHMTTQTQTEIDRPQWDAHDFAPFLTTKVVGYFHSPYGAKSVNRLSPNLDSRPIAHPLKLWWVSRRLPVGHRARSRPN
jgi:hypothetical protein